MVFNHDFLKRLLTIDCINIGYKKEQAGAGTGMLMIIKTITLSAN